MHSTEGPVEMSTSAIDPVNEAPAASAIAVTEGGHGTQGGDIHLPPPSIWPFTTAAGLALGGMGLVTSTVISILGLVIMAWGLFSWVQELRHERH